MASTSDFVIGSQFIAQMPLEVIVDKYPSNDLMITNINHKVLLKVKPCDSILHRQRMLVDANDKPIATLREKIMSMHTRWNVYRGVSKADSDIILSAKTEHMIHRKTNVSVTSANNHHGCDLRIKGRWSKGNCTIFLGDSSTIVAQIHKPQATKYANEKFMVTIQPNMDYACVVALLAIVDAMENPDKVKDDSGALAVVNAFGAISLS